MTDGTKQRCMRPMTRRGILQSSLLLAAPVLARAQSRPLKRVTLAIHYLPRGDYAPYYLARERGYYADRGLDLVIQHVVGNALAFQALSAGSAQFVHADMTQMLQLQFTQPNPALRSIAIAIDRCPMTLFYLAGKGIGDPKDLEGRTIVDSAGSNTAALLKLFCRANGVDGEKIAWKIAAPSAKVALMLQGQADFVATDYQAKAGLDAKLRPDQKLGGFVFGEHGVNTLGDGLITTDSFIGANRDAVAGFTAATLHGFRDAQADPQAAVDAIAKHVLELDPEVALKEMALWQALVTGPDQQAHGLGYHSADKMQATWEAAATIVGQAAPQPASAYYTNDFLA